jgi:hypothetical protein
MDVDAAPFVHRFGQRLSHKRGDVRMFPGSNLCRSWHEVAQSAGLQANNIHIVAESRTQGKKARLAAIDPRA